MRAEHSLLALLQHRDQHQRVLPSFMGVDLSATCTHPTAGFRLLAREKMHLQTSCSFHKTSAGGRKVYSDEMRRQSSISTIRPQLISSQF